MGGGVTKRGGPNRNQGRKAIKAGEPTVTVSLRMTETHRDKLKRLGGGRFVRGQIESAPEPTNENMEGEQG